MNSDSFFGDPSALPVFMPLGWRTAARRAAVAALLDLMRGNSGLRVQSAALLDEYMDLVREVCPAEASRIRSEVALIVGPYMLARMAAGAAG